MGAVATGRGSVVYVINAGDPTHMLNYESRGNGSTASKTFKIPLGLVVHIHKSASGGWYACEIDRAGDDAILFRVYHVESREKTVSQSFRIGTAFREAYTKLMGETGKEYKSRGATAARDFGINTTELQEWLYAHHGMGEIVYVD